MACDDYLYTFKAELSCPVCLEYFKNAVTLSCGHTFCKNCVQLSWDSRSDLACPACRSISPSDSLTKNHTINKMVALVLKDQDKTLPDVCKLHGERLQYFCMTDKESICSVCNSISHQDHDVYPAEEIAQEKRLKWMNMKQALERRKEQYASQRQRYDDIMCQNQKQFLMIATFIKNDFQKLHSLLHEQEKNNISDLKVELEQKTNLIDGEVKHLIDAVANLNEQLKELDKELNADDHVILKKSCSQKRRIACIAGKLKPIAKDTLIDISHHRGYVQYRACREMLSNIEVVPFTFDINTASPWLGVSEDLTKVSKTGGSIPFETPGRLESVPGILGSRGFCCGSHTWKVSIDNVQSWRVGVVSSTDGHLQLFKQESENKYFFIYKEEGCDGVCRVSDASKIELQLITPLEIVRVELDCDEGELSFYDAENEIHLYTFYDYFSSKVFPYFNIGTLESHNPAGFLEICSMDLCLQILPKL